VKKSLQILKKPKKNKHGEKQWRTRCPLSKTTKRGKLVSCPEGHKPIGLKLRELREKISIQSISG
jgi:hypothetical protein